MTDRVKHTAGFTLAELMMSIAIILVLAAIAIPSFITAQNNMRMVELNSAAQSIANAAQTQMTAKKVSGTWMDLVRDGDNYKSDFPVARLAQTDTNVRLMTAVTARSQGIVPSLSIDDTVRNADYIIEFDASTASVTRVFYSDGKSGFFGTSTPADGAVLTYYTANGAAPDDQDRRLRNNPMVGYYEGTPVGATSEVALRNPVIWVDEKTGCLMIQDPNISEDGSAGSTNTTVRIENTTQGVSFVLSGLSKEASTLSVSDDEGTDAFGLSGSEASDVVVLVGRDGVAPGNVYSIDLNKLSDKATAKGSDTLKGVFAKCQRNDDLKVQVELQDSQRPCVPAKAAANIKWPESVGKLTFMVTNPYSEAVKADEAADDNASDGDGESQASPYKEPVVLVTDDTGDPAVGKDVMQLSEDMDHYLRRTDANAKLKSENAQAAYQSYKGASVPSSSVRNDSTFRFQATVGSYNQHEYQIWELWLKRADNGEMMRVGYLNGDAWEWAKFTQAGVQYDYAPLNECFTWYDKNGTSYNSIAGMDTDELGIVTVAFNASAFYNTASTYPGLQIADEDDNAMLYVRTAPRSSEVQAYFTSLSKSDTQGQGSDLVASFLKSGTDQTSSRGANPSSTSARAAFEGEFGASSSDASWVVTSQIETGFEQGTSYLNKGANVRVYYSIAPAIGFKNIREYGGGQNDQYLSGVRSTRMTQVALWLFRGESFDALEAMPEALLKNENDFEYTCRSGSNYDFKLTTLEDFRFYRVLSYYDDDAKTKLDYPDQYVPHVLVDDGDVATIQSLPNKEDEDYIYEFSGWTTSDTKDGVGSVACAAGDLVGAYVEQLNQKGTKLSATYAKKEKPKTTLGLVYLEFDQDGNVLGSYGYTDYRDGSEPLRGLGFDNQIADWGYFLLVPADTPFGQIEIKGSIGPNSFAKGEVIAIGDALYYAYRIKTENVSDSLRSQRYLSLGVSLKKTDLSATFYLNVNFAHAVTMDDEAAKQWGTAVDPWSVRHAAQFPGSLKWNNGINLENGVNVSLQSFYMSHHFVQEHDLDMADANRYLPSAVKFNEVFRGTYTGKSGEVQYEIDNAYVYCMTKDGNGYYSGNNHGQGLFGEIDGATLNNIVLTISGSQVVLSGAGQQSFGLLVGYAQSSFINDCAVVGRPDADGNEASLLFKSANQSPNGMGCLVGYFSGSQMYRSRVEQVEWAYSRMKDEDWGDTVKIGGLVGSSTGSSLYACSIEDSVFKVVRKTSYSASKDGLLFGGFIGYAVGSQVYNENLNHPKLSGITLRLAADLNEKGFSAGSLAGKSDVPFAPIDWKPEKAWYQIGEGELVPFDATYVGKS